MSTTAPSLTRVPSAKGSPANRTAGATRAVKDRTATGPLPPGAAQAIAATWTLLTTVTWSVAWPSPRQSPGEGPHTGSSRPMSSRGPDVAQIQSASGADRNTSVPAGTMVKSGVKVTAPAGGSTVMSFCPRVPPSPPRQPTARKDALSVRGPGGGVEASHPQPTTRSMLVPSGPEVQQMAAARAANRSRSAPWATTLSAGRNTTGPGVSPSERLMAVAFSA
mmetsp:Transcript_125263/g.217113  ORF Transcript_125263/g.217113 Transcript_125263/m.217113 type:complete len:221 (-) Transcript_125263:405-1067(-)